MANARLKSRYRTVGSRRRRIGGARLPRGVIWLLLLTAGLGACWTTSEPHRDGGAPAPVSRATPVFTPTPVRRVTEPAKGWFESGCALPRDILERIRRGYYPDRSPDVIVVPREPNYFGGFSGTSHSGPWDYVQEVPLVFYGPGFIKSRGDLRLGREVTLADLAPTLAELLGFSYPGTRGISIDEALVPESKRPSPPRVIVTVVLDGGGWNVLRAWPDAWPNYARLMEEGASVSDVIVGSSPSVTPAVHTTIGTGVFPKQHGITGIGLKEGDSVVGAFAHKSPEHLTVPTLADVYDPATGNQSKIGMLAYKSWHLGMIGHGAYASGGDKDIAAIVNTSEQLVTNRELYSLPSYLGNVGGLEEDIRSVDLEDGKRDFMWQGHKVLDDPAERRDTPVWVRYQTRLLEELIEREGFGRDEVPDLLFTNYKHLDEVGHNYNMLSVEMQAIIRSTDETLLEELPRFLDSTVGKKRWVMVVTADHGQGPDAQAAHAWPIAMELLSADIAEHFGLETGDLILSTSPVGFWFKEETMQKEGITEDEIAEFLLDYRLEDNVNPNAELPQQYEPRLQEPIFSAAFPSAGLPRIWGCAKDS